VTNNWNSILYPNIYACGDAAGRKWARLAQVPFCPSAAYPSARLPIRLAPFRPFTTTRTWLHLSAYLLLALSR
jgi:hypothetical protein